MVKKGALPPTKVTAGLGGVKGGGQMAPSCEHQGSYCGEGEIWLLLKPLQLFLPAQCYESELTQASLHNLKLQINLQISSLQEQSSSQTWPVPKPGGGRGLLVLMGRGSYPTLRWSTKASVRQVAAVIASRLLFSGGRGKGIGVATWFLRGGTEGFLPIYYYSASCGNIATNLRVPEVKRTFSNINTFHFRDEEAGTLRGEATRLGALTSRWQRPGLLPPRRSFPTFLAYRLLTPGFQAQAQETSAPHTFRWFPDSKNPTFVGSPTPSSLQGASLPTSRMRGCLDQSAQRSMSKGRD